MASKRILLITPEITYLPEGMGNMANYLNAKAGGLADVSASLVSQLYQAKLDVHVALPNYRTMFSRNIARFIDKELSIYRKTLPEDRIHLAEDRCFYYRDSVYDNFAVQNLRLSLAFQREVINNIIPRVQPDIIHCNDWMTGLIPAVAHRLGIPCLFTVHNIHSIKTNLAQIEEAGIDAAQFWPYFFFERPPTNYEETREMNRVDFLVSGIFAATAVNTVSPTFLEEIINGRHPFIHEAIVREFAHKVNAGNAIGVLNAPDPSFAPQTDEALARNYAIADFRAGKDANKLVLQRMLGMAETVQAPLFFWPSRLDPGQKGCKLLADIFYDILGRHEDMQIVIVANGPFQKEFHSLVSARDLRNRVSVCDFEENLSRLAYAAADFLFMPSSFEPCGLPQMIGPIYGTLPIAHDTGGIHDTVAHLSLKQGTGNGFLFEVHDALGLRWAVDQAMDFHCAPVKTKDKNIARIMTESAAKFNQHVNTEAYRTIYRHILKTGKPQ